MTDLANIFFALRLDYPLHGHQTDADLERQQRFGSILQATAVLDATPFRASRNRGTVMQLYDDRWGLVHDEG
jgi:hypothetical protein